MIKSRAMRYLLCLGLALALFTGLVGSQVALAAGDGNDNSFSVLPNQEELPPDILELTCKYPVLRGVSGHAFEFLIEATYRGTKDRVFDISLDQPPQWDVSVTGKYETEQIESFTMKTFEPVAPEFKVVLSPVPGYEPEPGEYKLIFTATSEEVTASVELEAIVTARYELELIPGSGRLNTEATVGEENHISIILVNRGSAPIEDLSFTSSKPEGWSITYTPDHIDTLGAGLAQEVDINIEPPEKTIAGDYSLTINVEGKPDLFDSLQYRVTVLTPSIWGWVGIIIVVVVVAGLAFLFRRLGRR
jgi:uncharacterized membrane protein